MRRLTATIACMLLLAVLGACADDVNLSDRRGKELEPETGTAMNDQPGDQQNPTAGRTGPLPDGGAASCVESYEPKAVARRAFAFDGVVVAVGPSVSDRGDEADLRLPGVTFQVRAWFSGGMSETVTVDMQVPAADSAGLPDSGFAYGIGSRLLVSGEARWGGSPLKHPIAWGCGFTRYYDPATAIAWHDAVAG